MGVRELLIALLSDRIRVLGVDHPHTLSTRSNAAVLDGAGRGSQSNLEQLHGWFLCMTTVGF